MESPTKVILAAIGVGLFGLFLLWQGITDNITKLENGRALIPRCVYIFTGAFLLLMPIVYFVLLLKIK